MYQDDYKRWLDAELIDFDLKKELQDIQGDDDAIKERFAVALQFGTAGLRGTLGAGTNRMNIWVVRQATQGVADWVKTQGGTQTVAISYDSRLKGWNFARDAAGVLAANGINVRIYDELMPVPALSFATRYYKCNAGIMVTASHNPAKYNGYKAYGPDGCQMTDDAAAVVYDSIQKTDVLTGAKYMSFAEGVEKGLIKFVGDDCKEALYEAIEARQVRPGLCKTAGLKLVYSPLNGTGLVPVTRVLKDMGITDITIVPEQEYPNGYFTTCSYPNPEIFAALEKGLELAKEVGADLMLATDPDADRVGIAAKNNKGEFELLNGNQTGSILIYYLLNKWKENGKLKGKEFIVKTIVTTELLAAMAKDFGVEYYDVLTGFKFIADAIKRNEGKKQFIGGGEESYGYLCGDFVRDKDAVMSSSLIAEAAAWAFSQGKSLFDLLAEIYVRYGFYREKLINVVKKGKSGAEEIQQMMTDFRSNPPKQIAGSEVVCIKDYKLGKAVDQKTKAETEITLPKSNVLQFITADGTIVSVRPSGTEPKIKFYIGTKMPLANASEYQAVANKLNDKIAAICSDLKLA